MLRASSNGKPTGFVATQMAAISQPWYEPYDALKEQAAILTEQYQNNSKWTYGGIAMNGCFKMLDNFASTGPNVSDTWIVFGDPSLLVFTDNPVAMTVSHANAINLGATTFDVNCNMKNALISLTVGGEIIGTAYSNGGLTPVAISPALTTTLTSMQVTITAKNKIPYSGNVTIGVLSVDGKDINNEISIYPNPATQLLSVNFGDIQKNNVGITVFDLFGKKIVSMTNPKIVNNTTDIDVSSLPSGVYFVRITTDNISKTAKVTVLR
jgi:gingipain R